MRLAAILSAVALLAASLAACGSSDSGPETTRSEGAQQRTGQASAPPGASARGCAGAPVEGLRVTDLSCSEGQRVALRWRRGKGCQPAAGSSRAGCRVGSYRCTAVRSDRGVAVSCARPGRTVAFIAPRGG